MGGKKNLRENRISVSGAKGRRTIKKGYGLTNKSVLKGLSARVWGKKHPGELGRAPYDQQRPTLFGVGRAGTRSKKTGKKVLDIGGKTFSGTE